MDEHEEREDLKRLGIILAVTAGLILWRSLLGVFFG